MYLKASGDITKCHENSYVMARRGSQKKEGGGWGVTGLDRSDGGLLLC